jgi:hypothetical protein
MSKIEPEPDYESKFLNTNRNLRMMYDSMSKRDFSDFGAFMEYLENKFPNQEGTLIEYNAKHDLFIPHYGRENYPKPDKLAIGEIIHIDDSYYLTTVNRKFVELVDGVVEYKYCQTFGYQHFIDYRHKYGFNINLLIIDSLRCWAINLNTSIVDCLKPERDYDYIPDDMLTRDDIIEHGDINKYGWENIAETGLKYQLSAVEIFDFKTHSIGRLKVFMEEKKDISTSTC